MKILNDQNCTALELTTENDQIILRVQDVIRPDGSVPPEHEGKDPWEMIGGTVIETKQTLKFETLENLVLGEVIECRDRHFRVQELNAGGGTAVYFPDIL